MGSTESSKFLRFKKSLAKLWVQLNMSMSTKTKKLASNNQLINNNRPIDHNQLINNQRPLDNRSFNQLINNNRPPIHKLLINNNRPIHKLLISNNRPIDNRPS